MWPARGYAVEASYEARRLSCGRVDAIAATPARRDAGNSTIRIFELRLGQGSTTGRRVPDGLQAPINTPALEHRREDPQLSCFILRLQRQVGRVPIGPDAIPLK